jgi:predicted nucleic acid-binding protein
VAESRTQAFVAALGRLNIAVDDETAARALSDTLNLARRYKLSAYDATYLELALRAGLPLATLDADLLKAAGKAGVKRYAAR